MGTGSPRQPTGPDVPQEPIDRPKQAPTIAADDLKQKQMKARGKYRSVLGILIDPDAEAKMGRDLERVHEEVVEIAPGETEPKAESI